MTSTAVASGSVTWMTALIFLISLLSLAFAGYLAAYVLRKETGTPAMRVISDAIREGAEAFLRRQYRTIALLSVVVAALLLAFYGFEKGDWPLATKIVASFLIGAACSALAGYVGMYVSIRANIRTASAARTSLGEALAIALRGGAVSGLAVVALSLLGVGGLFVLFGGLATPQAAQQVPYQIVGFGFGASFVALFAQLGGGIYTKAADVGADLVGKVEAGIPEDDPRNPAVIADLVGDNVGDCAGRGADLFESTAAENIGAMILGVALYPVYGIGGVLFPLVARAFGLIATIVGILAVRAREDEDPMAALNRGYYVASALAIAGFYVAVRWLLGNNLWFFAAGVIGVLTAIAFVYITQYYTEYKFRPVREIAQASQTGPATNIITGFAVGLECTALPVFVISAALLGAYYAGVQSGIQQLAPGITDAQAGLYGTAVATMGMLGTAAYILAMDTFGPITDNAGGIIEMSRQPDEIRRRTDRLDAVGNTTKALTKGYAIGSAALAAFLLFSAYLDEVTALIGRPFHVVDLGKIEVFIGALLGAMLVFWFSALAIKAVGRAAYYVIHEVRRQFKENPAIMQGTAKPDYARCVDIVTRGALRQMVLPGLLAVVVPTAVGLLLGPEPVAGLLMVGTIGGILLATLMNNGGGAWDNAKKYIEAGQYGGKRSEAHKAAVVGDTVGDPFKDTAGPSLHVLIKLLSTITLVLAPLFIR
ncbi:MAG TPA: sodium-translocating pyrophosphatase [Thermodesulfobacteriota bacterium]|nr:sodium-translocating pyrophosphatase [Thermodesulfobacteriota bacterium]